MCSSRLAAGMLAACATYFCITSDLHHMAAMFVAHQQRVKDCRSIYVVTWCYRQDSKAC